MATMQAPAVVNGSNLLQMSPAARQQYMAGLSPKQQADQMAKLQDAIFAANRRYMKETVRKKAICPPSSGSGTNQTYATGSTLNFNVPTAINGYLEGFYVRLNLVVDFATGTSAVYAATAARELALIQQISVLYNGTQMQFKPYILKPLQKLTGIYQPGWPNSVLAGTHNTTTDSYLTQGSLPITGTSQTITLEYYVPMNLLHPQDVRGMLPIDGNSTTAQISLQTATALLGNDPALNTWYAVSGSGHAVTLTSGQSQTVQILACYRDGTTMTQVDSLPMYLQGLGTVQFLQDVQLTGLTGGTTYSQKLTILMPHYYVLLTAIDGQQATSFCTNSNIAYLALATDSTASSTFWKYGTGTNLSIQEFFNEIRFQFDQDLDQGILPLAYAPTYMEADPNNQNGSAILNCTAATGWTDIHYLLQFSSLASTLSGVTPRVEAHCVYLNPQGLIASV